MTSGRQLSAFSMLLVLYALAISQVGNIITNHIVYSTMPLAVVTASSIATFPASIAIIVVAVASYLKTHRKKLLSIILGIVVVSVAGTLYIVQFPALLYYAEAVGIALLWLWFY